jgi:hypothetical protein
VDLGSNNVVKTSGNSAGNGNMIFQGGTDPSTSRGVIFRSTTSVQTNGGSITVPGSSSSVLIDSSSGNPVRLASVGGGDITIAGTLDNRPTTTSDIDFSTSGSVTITGAVGNTNNPLGNIVIYNDAGGTGANNLTLSSFVKASRLAVANAASALRGNINVVGDVTLNNGVLGESALWLQTVTGGTQNINFNGTISAVTSTGNSQWAQIKLDGGTNASLQLAKGATTTGELLITRMNKLTLGNSITNSTLQSGINAISVTSPITLAGNVSFVSTANQAVSLGGGITGPGNKLTVSTGGDVTLGSMGAASPAALGDISIPQSSSSLTFNGTYVNVGKLTTGTLTGPIDISTPATSTFNGDVVLTTTGAQGTITLGKMDLNLLGNVSLDASSDVTLKGSVTNILNSFNQKAGTKVVVGYTNGSAITLSNTNGSSTGFIFSSPVQLAQALTINASTGTPVTFQSTIDNSQASKTQALTITTTNADVIFNNKIGATASLGALLSFSVTTSGIGRVQKSKHQEM